MKTAEEWCSSRAEWIAKIDGTKLEWLKDTDWYRDRINLTKQIQLDAMKEGMRRAAEQARQTGLLYGDYDPSRDGRIVGNAAQEDILTAAEQLTEKDL